MTDTVSQEMLEAARGYEALFVPALFAQWCDPVLAAAGMAAGQDVLDIACGTGVLARAARAVAGPGARVTGVDPAPGMIGVARARAPEIEWLEGSAEALPVEDAAFDRVVSQFGMMFFQDRAAAAREMARVLRSGGRLAIAVWDSVLQNPAYGDIAALMLDEIGEAAAQAVQLPFSLGDTAEVVDTLAIAGFAETDVQTHTGRARFPSTRHLVEAELRGWLPLFGIHLDDARVGEILTASDARLAPYRNPDGAADFPVSAHVIAARRP